MRHTKFGVIILMLCALLFCVGATQGSSVTISGMDLTFELPSTMISEEIPTEAAAAGAAYAGQNADQSLRFVLLMKPVKRSGTLDVAALISYEQDGESVAVDETLEVAGHEFVLTSEAVGDGDEQVFFRVATAVINQKQLMFFFIDRTGEYADIARDVVSSIRIAKEEVKP